MSHVPVAILAALLSVLPASPALAAGDSGPGPPTAPAAKGTFDRDDVLMGVTLVDGITGAWTAYELLSGRSSGMFNGLTLVATGPAVAYGAAVLGQNANDPAIWVATLAAGTIFTLAAIDIVKRHLRPGEPYKAVARNFRNIMIVPRLERVDSSANEKTTRVGLALAGTF